MLPQKVYHHQANQQPQSQLGSHLRDHSLRQRALFQEKHRHQ